MITDLILGTAGHIDHGKTSLIKSLTGVDTDRLPEEKRRGITIDLGFAELQVGSYRLGIVDVPGHERFVRQMLAGATGMDLAMLVVAADDSVKLQTREHFDVLRILDLPGGVLVLTKCDTADADWMALVEDEVRDLVRGSFLEGAPLIRTSAVTGQGIDQLKQALHQVAEQVAATTRSQPPGQPFRMAIDRAFTIAGHGTVVTGSVSSGQAVVGEQLVIEPGGIEVRVRGLQNHDRTTEQISRGQRAAVNLAGIHHDRVTRGHELATPGYLVPSRLLTAKIQVLPHSPWPLKHRSRIRLHVGTAEVLATVSLPAADRIAPGQDADVQLFLQEPVVTVWNQPFVLRSESPVVTIAGGRVLVPAATKLRRSTEVPLRYLQQLQSPDSLHRAAAAIYFADSACQGPDDLTRTAGVDRPADRFAELLQQEVVVELTHSGQRRSYIHRQRLEEYADRILAYMERLHERNPLQTVFDRARLLQQFAYLGGAPVAEAVLQKLQRDGLIRVTPRGIGLSGRGPKLSKGEQELSRRMLEAFRAGRLPAPYGPGMSA